MHRYQVRSASLLLLLAACQGDVASTATESTSESSSSTTDASTTTNSSTTVDLPTTSSDPTTGTSTTDGTSTTNVTSTTTTTGDTDSTSTTTTTTGDTDSTSTTTGSTTDDTTTTGPVTCPNGMIDPGESCDGDLLNDETCVSQGFDDGTLACAADCTFDTSACSILSCGNNKIEGNEVCDGSDLADQTCESQGFDGGTLACADNCGEFDTTACFSCGDNAINGTETCDGSDLGGETCASQGFVGGELGCQADCGGFDTAMCTNCGNDAIDMSETCDGADLGGETCTSQGFFKGSLACQNTCDDFDVANCSNCGNGVIDAPEVCDGNNVGNAKCSDQGLEYGFACCGQSCGGISKDYCADELLESEPNDDGMVATGTNDFSAVNADGPITANTVVVGAITPAGDDDYYAVTNTGLVDAILTAETFGPLGPGTCPYNSLAQDTRLEIRDANNVMLANDDDAGIGYCSRIANYVVAPGATVYVRAFDREDDSVIASYFLGIDLRPVVCGDGFLAPSEQCDDGNVASNDGCSATCTLDAQTNEIEPNNTNAEADATGLVSTGHSWYTGAISTNTDVDRYRLNLAKAEFVRLETFSKHNDCNAVTTTLRVFNDANVSVITDTAGSGIQGCGALVFPLPMGSSYVQVEESGLNATIPLYQLDMQVLTATGNETEPNDTQAQANTNLGSGSDVMVFGDHSVGSDSDYYAITVPSCGGSLRLEIIEGDRAVETCESNGVDSQIFLYNSAGTLLDQDDDTGRGFCSLIDGTGSVPSNPGAHKLAPGTYYLQVKASTLASMTQAQFIYRLVATIRTP